MNLKKNNKIILYWEHVLNLAGNTTIALDSDTCNATHSEQKLAFSFERRQMVNNNNYSALSFACERDIRHFMHTSTQCS